MKLHVTPFYGWGWYKSNGDLFDVPGAFDLDVSVVEGGQPFRAAVRYLAGEGTHKLAGLWIVLAQRHTPADGQCNLYVFLEKPLLPKLPQPFPVQPVITGFASASPIGDAL